MKVRKGLKNCYSIYSYNYHRLQNRASVNGRDVRVLVMLTRLKLETELKLGIVTFR